MMKSELIPKSKHRNQMLEAKTLKLYWRQVDMGFMFVAFGFGAFDIVSKFRVSCFGFL